MKKLFFIALMALAMLQPIWAEAAAPYPAHAAAIAHSLYVPTPADTLKAIRLEQPKDVVITGKEQIITWTANFTDTVRIELFKNEVLYATVEYRIASRPGANSFVWNVPANFPKGGGYRIVVQSVNDNNLNGKSNLLTFKADSKNNRRYIWIAGSLILAVGLSFLGIQLARPRTGELPEPPLPDGQ
ncbi:hypothetical protein [Rhodoflexus sp.]